MHNVVKWPNIRLYGLYGLNTARFLKYVWPFYNIMRERVKEIPVKSLYIHVLEEVAGRWCCKHKLPESCDSGKTS